MRRLDHCRFRTFLLLTVGLSICLGVVALAPSCAQAQAEGEDITGRWRETLKLIRARFPAVAHISTDTLQSWLSESPKGENLLLFDVREPQEYAVSHLPGARPVPSRDEALKALQNVSPNLRIVLYCSVGYRSSDLAGFLMKRGFTKVYNLEGSIFAWANEERPVYRGKERVRVVHPYDNNWGRLLKKSLRLVDQDDSRVPQATSQ